MFLIAWNKMYKKRLLHFDSMLAKQCFSSKKVLKTAKHKPYKASVCMKPHFLSVWTTMTVYIVNRLSVCLLKTAIFTNVAPVNFTTNQLCFSFPVWKIVTKLNPFNLDIKVSRESKIFFENLQKTEVTFSALFLTFTSLTVSTEKEKQDFALWNCEI